MTETTDHKADWEKLSTLTGPAMAEMKDNTELTYREWKIINAANPDPEPRIWKSSKIAASTGLLLALLLMPLGVIIMLICSFMGPNGFLSMWNAIDLGVLVFLNILKFIAVRREAPWIHTFNAFLFVGLSVGSFLEVALHSQVGAYYFVVLILEDLWVIVWTFFMVKWGIKLRAHAIYVRRLLNEGRAAKVAADAAKKEAETVISIPAVAASSSSH
ncbi:hypothetical protein BCR33DRAFT_851736 [Rhizoclosmatium globosum]|uniref:Uncharacterized protein n=1 Tax=Rhizoclosmatium globosum TaxID=329046 RepID=A0A1Y2C578_9FUNG|nr:hypothetical protein BCR33DRAFT_851736 [Rhizoclosmatium globosum]|eukprot:ORY42200.1 hypothetical protein BCR33DRAFT_851736 [Rhizoclosmatium globosum]